MAERCTCRDAAAPPTTSTSITKRATSTSARSSASASGSSSSAVVVHLRRSGCCSASSTRREARARRAEYPLAAAQENRLPPEPRLQTNPREDLRELARAAKTQILDVYGWVDRNAGVVRIPIDEAMKLTLERGLPADGSEQTR